MYDASQGIGLWKKVSKTTYSIGKDQFFKNYTQQKEKARHMSGLFDKKAGLSYSKKKLMISS